MVTLVFSSTVPMVPSLPMTSGLLEDQVTLTRPAKAESGREMSVLVAV